MWSSDGQISVKSDSCFSSQREKRLGLHGGENFDPDDRKAPVRVSSLRSKMSSQVRDPTHRVSTSREDRPIRSSIFDKKTSLTASAGVSHGDSDSDSERRFSSSRRLQSLESEEVRSPPVSPRATVEPRRSLIADTLLLASPPPSSPTPPSSPNYVSSPSEKTPKKDRHPRSKPPLAPKPEIPPREQAFRFSPEPLSLVEEPTTPSDPFLLTGNLVDLTEPLVAERSSYAKSSTSSALSDLLDLDSLSSKQPDPLESPTTPTPKHVTPLDFLTAEPITEVEFQSAVPVTKLPPSPLRRQSRLEEEEPSQVKTVTAVKLTDFIKTES